MLDARLAQPARAPTPITTETLTADQVENGWGRDRVSLLQCGADKSAIVGGYQELRGLLAGTTK